MIFLLIFLHFFSKSQVFFSILIIGIQPQGLFVRFNSLVVFAFMNMRIALIVKRLRAYIVVYGSLCHIVIDL